MKIASRIFGAENDKLSEYQKKVNDASYKICKQKPSLLFGKKGDIVTMPERKCTVMAMYTKRILVAQRNMVQDMLMTVFFLRRMEQNLNTLVTVLINRLSLLKLLHSRRFCTPELTPPFAKRP